MVQVGHSSMISGVFSKTAPVQFRGDSPEGVPNADQQIQKIRKALENVKTSHPYIATPENGEALLHAADKATAEKKQSFSSMLRTAFKGPVTALFIGLAALSGGSLYQMNQTANQAVEAKKAHDRGAISFDEYWDQSHSSFGMLLLSVFSTLGTAGMVLVGSAALGETGFALRKALKESKNLEALSLRVQPETEAANQRLAGFLNNKIEQAAENFSGRFLKAYDSRPELKALYDKVFGSRDQLPKKDDIVKLFHFIALQQVQSEREANIGQAFQPRSGVDHAIHVYSLLQTAMGSGDIVRFLKSDPADTRFQQKFNTALSQAVGDMESRVRRQLEPVTQLIHKELELQNYLDTAQLALSSMQLSVSHSEADIERVLKVIGEFRSKQESVKSELNREDDSLNIDPALLSDVKVELAGTVSHMQALLAQEHFESTVTQAHQKALTSISKPS